MKNYYTFIYPDRWLPAGITLISLFFVIIKTYGFNYYAGDEYIYLMQGKLVSEGLIPYTDFSAAHPPFQMLFFAFFFKLIDYSFLFFRVLPLIFSLITALLIALLIRKRHTVTAALVAMTSYLFAYEVLRASTHLTGVNMTVTLIAASIFFIDKNAFKTGALFLVLSVFTRLYAIPAVVAIILWYLIKDYKRAINLIIYGMIFGIAGSLATVIWCGYESTIYNLFEFHKAKTAMTPERIKNMHYSVLFHNAIPLSLFILSSLWSFISIIDSFIQNRLNRVPFLKNIKNIVTNEKNIIALISISGFIIHGVILINLNRVWMYYYVPLFLFTALGSAAGIDLVINTVKSLFSKKIELNSVIFAAIIIILFGCSAYYAPKLEQNLIYYKKEMKKPIQAKIHTYTFVPAYLPDFINNAIQSYIWSDTRIIGNRYSSLTFLLWHESRYFNILNDVAGDINLNCPADKKIFGDSGTVPMLSLVTGLKIAKNKIDTNIARYKTDFENPHKLAIDIDNSRTELIFLRISNGRGFGVAALPDIRRLVSHNYSLLKKYKTKTGRIFLLFKRKKNL